MEGSQRCEVPSLLENPAILCSVPSKGDAGWMYTEQSGVFWKPHGREELQLVLSCKAALVSVVE